MSRLPPSPSVSDMRITHSKIDAANGVDLDLGIPVGTPLQSKVDLDKEGEVIRATTVTVVPALDPRVQ